MIHVTCSECGTTYRVEERLLGADGRKVRCTSCNATWHQAPPPLEEEAPAAAPEEAAPDWMEDEKPGDDDLDFRSVAKGQYFHEDDIEIPEAVKPAQDAPPAPAPFQIPVMTYRPMGMGAGQFGVFVFLLLSFLTLSGLFVFKHQVVNRAPMMAHFYKTLGFSLKAPGEGLALSEMTAESMAGGGKRVLSVGAKLANVTQDKIGYPALQVKLKGAYGGVLKTWEFRPEKGLALGPGESVPVDLSFKDAPEDGKTVELTVIDR